MLQVSVVICTYNREKYIAEALESIRNQGIDYKHYEVLVIDNNSSDRSGEIIKNFIAANPGLPFYYIHEGNQGLSFARNAGIQHARADIVAFIDDDAIARADYIENLVHFFNMHPDVAAVGGKVIPKFTEGEPVWLSKYVRKVVSEIDFGHHAHQLEGRRYPFGANMSFRASAFTRYGVFNTNLGRKGKSMLGGEEKDIFDRMKHGGEKIWYDPQVMVWHIIDPHRLTMDYLSRFCKGVGVSERIRLKDKAMPARFAKWAENKVKRAGSLVLGAMYYMKGEKEKGKMIIDVMRWIEEGYYKGDITDI